MICEHTYGGGMEFRDSSSDYEDSAFSTIQQINVGSPSPHCSSRLKSWQDEHKQEIRDIKERYENLANHGFHLGSFQCIHAAWPNENKKSVLSNIGLSNTLF